MNAEQSEVLKQTISATPSFVAIIIGWLDAPISEWSFRFGIAFIALQSAYLVWQWHQKAKDVKVKREMMARGLFPPDTDRAPLR